MGRIKYRRNLFINIVRHVILYGSVVIFVGPYFWTFISSIKPQKDMFTLPPRVIFTPTLRYYQQIIQIEGFLPALKNSMILATFSSLLGVTLGALAGYGFARFYFRGRGEIVALGVFSIRFIPYIVIVLPLFMLMRGFALTGTHLGLIIAMQIIHIPFVTWLMRSFFCGMPPSAEEAGMLDGLSRLGVFLRIALPMAAPALASALILTFIFSWNQFLLPLLLAGKYAKPLTLGLSRYTGALEYGPRWGLLSAWAFLTVTPVVVLVFVIRKFVVSGLMGGAET